MEEPATDGGRTRWWIAGGLAAVALGAIAVAAWGVERVGVRPAGGHVVATRGQTLELRATTARIDADAEVRWRRAGHQLVIEQPRGAAMWQVADEDTAVIDAGATVASVEASGASLRVEVKMLDRTETRHVAGSAMVSAAVALVTVVVYEGTVKVTHDGNAVTVEAGTMYEVRSPALPQRPSRASIRRVMEDLGAALAGCGSGEGGLELDVDVQPSGAVTSATVKEVPRPTPLVVACIQDVVQGATFPRSTEGVAFVWSERQYGGHVTVQEVDMRARSHRSSEPDASGAASPASELREPADVRSR